MAIIRKTLKSTDTGRFKRSRRSTRSKMPDNSKSLNLQNYSFFFRYQWITLSCLGASEYILGGGRLKERRLLLLAINDIGFFVAVCHGLHKWRSMTHNLSFSDQQHNYFWPSKVHVFWEGWEFPEISTLLLSYVVPVKSKVEISQNFVAFSEYMNFTTAIKCIFWYCCIILLNELNLF